MLTTNNKNVEPSQPRYSVKLNGRWIDDMIGLEDSKGSSESYAGILGIPIEDFTLGDGYEYEVRGKRGKWVKASKYDRNGIVGNNGPVTGLKIYGDDVIYAVHVNGGTWLPSVGGGEAITTGVSIDGVWVSKV